jgi:putative endonuclease
MACFCYIVECADGSFYTGWTTDPERRVKDHNGGRGGRYTRSRRPVRMVFLEQQPDRSKALKREIRIKRMTRSRKLKLIAEASRESPRRRTMPAIKRQLRKKGRVRHSVSKKRKVAQ